MEPRWLKMATSPGLCVDQLHLRRQCLIQSYVLYRLSRRIGTRLQIGERAMNEAVRVSLITSFGPALAACGDDGSGAGSRRCVRLRPRARGCRLDHV